jgi:hypothetical protein
MMTGVGYQGQVSGFIRRCSVWNLPALQRFIPPWRADKPHHLTPHRTVPYRKQHLRQSGIYDKALSSTGGIVV